MAIRGSLIQAAGLFAVTALAEIAGCYLAYGVLRLGRPTWWLIPSTLSIALFVWLLILHPGAAGRTYAAYGGMYIAGAFIWLWLVEWQQPSLWEIVGVVVSLFGMSIIILAPH